MPRIPKFPLEIKRGSATVRVQPYENNGSRHFLITWNALGKRKRESRATLEEAKARAEAIATSIQNGQIAALTLTGADRDSYIHSQQLLAPLGIPLHAAVEELVKIREIIGQHSPIEVAKDFQRRNLRPLKTADLPKLVQLCLDQKVSDGLSTRYRAQLKCDLKHLTTAFSKPVANITTDELEEWLRSLKGAPRTRNNIRTSVSTFFAFCRRNGYLPKGLPTEAEGTSRFKVRDQRITVLTPAQMKELLKAATPEMIPFIAIGGFSGLRSAEIQRLHWSEVMLDRGWIEVRPENAKTASRRLAPISENLKTWLKPHVAHGRVLKDLEIWRDVTALAAKQKISWERNILRHSAISYRVATTQDVNRVALESGNTPAIIFRHYRELVMPADAEEWWSISSAGSQIAEHQSDPRHC